MDVNLVPRADGGLADREAAERFLALIVVDDKDNDFYGDLLKCLVPALEISSKPKNWFQEREAIYEACSAD